MTPARMLLTRWPAALAFALVASPAQADVGAIATTVLGELTALAAPAILLGVIWLGVLIMTGRGTLITFFTFLVGVAIVASGGFF